MSDGLKTTTGETRMRAAAFALGSLLIVTQAAASPAAPLQELAGRSRAGQGSQPTLRPAMAEHPAERLPSIVFEPGSARLTPSATRLLDTFGRSLAEDRLRLGCRAGANRDLAARRAKAVAGYLVQNFGMRAERIEVVTVARADDRRVLVEDLGQ